MSKVALVRCESYDPAEVRRAVERGLSLLGESFWKPGERILLKPNLLAPDPPEKCTTTHPSVFRAVAEIAKEAGALVSYGDSPGMGPTSFAARRAGLAEVAEEVGIPLADFANGERVAFPEAHREFILAKGVLESEGLISLPKLKTHALTRVTGCIKNQFGCIPGTMKAELHTKLPTPQSFCDYLVDLNRFLKPRLFIMDGIRAMEGNGPRGGKPKALNLLLLSADPVALDATVCQLIGMDLSFVPTLAPAQAAGLGSYQHIEWLGDPLESFRPASFEAKREPVLDLHLSGPRLFRRLFQSLMSRPVITGNCVRCGICVEACPVKPKAIFWAKGRKDQPPVYQYNRCIRCFCCQEHCPQSAIEVKDPPLRRLFFRYSTPKT